MPKKPKVKSPKNETLQLIREVAQGEPPVGLVQTKALRALILLAQGAGFARGTIYSCPVEVLRDLLADSEIRHISKFNREQIPATEDLGLSMPLSNSRQIVLAVCR